MVDAEPVNGEDVVLPHLRLLDAQEPGVEPARQGRQQEEGGALHEIEAPRVVDGEDHVAAEHHRGAGEEEQQPNPLLHALNEAPAGRLIPVIRPCAQPVTEEPALGPGVGVVVVGDVAHVVVDVVLER